MFFIPDAGASRHPIGKNGKNIFQDPIMMSADFSGTGFFAGSLCSGTFG
jgi:hypothetical protein